MRALRRELRRGPALVLAVAVAGTGLFALFGGSAEVQWPGRWMGLAESTRQVLTLAVPLTLAAACWAAGRPRRRGARELFASTSRPGWQPQLVLCTGAWLGGVTGVGALTAMGAAFVLPVASYAGGGWWWAMLVVLPSLGVVAALGCALGAWSPWRGTAPVVALLLYAVGVLLGIGVQLGALSPTGRQVRLDTLISIDVPAAQLAWFGGLALVLLAVASLGARPVSRRWVAGALMAGIVLAVPGGGWLRAHRDDADPFDPGALELVCTHDEPRVCLHRSDAFTLDEVAPRAQALLRRLAPVAGMPRRVMPFDESTGAVAGPGDVLVVSRPDVDAFGHVAAEDVALTAGADDVSPLFESVTCTWAGDEALRSHRAALVSAAVAWSLQRPPRWPAAEESETWDALRALPEDGQLAFVEALVAAREQCGPDDVQRLRGLLGLS